MRGWQLGIEMRPWLAKDVLWVYPCYMAGFGAFGYWLEGVEQRQAAMLNERKQELLDKRARKAARDGQREQA